jgi:hypothetical protein
LNSVTNPSYFCRATSREEDSSEDFFVSTSSTIYRCYRGPIYDVLFSLLDFDNNKHVTSIKVVVNHTNYDYGYDINITRYTDNMGIPFDDYSYDYSSDEQSSEEY